MHASSQSLGSISSDCECIQIQQLHQWMFMLSISMKEIVERKTVGQDMFQSITHPFGEQFFFGFFFPYVSISYFHRFSFRNHIHSLTCFRVFRTLFCDSIFAYILSNLMGPAYADDTEAKPQNGMYILWMTFTLSIRREACKSVTRFRFNQKYQKEKIKDMA